MIMQYKPIPFLAVNDSLDKEKLKFILNKIDEQHLGGIFFHARIGLNNKDYLSKKWFDAIKETVKHAEKTGLTIWLYDENKWPSGYAGGLVPKKSIQFRDKALILKITKAYISGLNKNILKIYSSENFIDFTEISYNEDIIKKYIEQGHHILYFYIFVSELNDPFFNNTSYIDTMNPDAVKYFISVTHKQYKKYLGRYFGKIIPGIFFDEPSYLSVRLSNEKFKIPWTAGFEKIFLEKNNYSIKKHLPELFFNINKYKEIRYDYWKTVTELFVNSFTKQIYEWCGKVNLKTTGHLNKEDTLKGQITAVGDVMRHYEYMHYPGIDQLFNNIDNYFLTLKQVVSAAGQLGKKRVLSESFGASGQNLSFYDRFRIANFLFFHGVNFINEHLYLYSLKGKRKTDFPPTLSHHQPWWKYNQLITDYFTKMSEFISASKSIAPILLIHPITSAWILYSPVNTKAIDKLDKDFYELMRALSAAQFDFDLGNETLIKKYSTIKKNRFCVGKKEYKIVILPYLNNLEETTLILLSKAVKNNIPVIILGEKPGFVNGKVLNDLLAETVFVNNTKQLIKLLDSYNVRKIILKKNKYIFSKVLVKNRKTYYLIYNSSKTKKIRLNFSLGKINSTQIKIYDFFNSNIKYICKKKSTGFQYEISPGELMIFTADNAKLLPHSNTKIKKIYLNPNGWKLTKVGEKNILVLDYACLDNDDEAHYIPIVRMQNIIKNKGLKKFRVYVKFKADFVPKDINLIIENLCKYRITLNNSPVKFHKKNYFLDDSFLIASIKDKVKQGENIIVVEGEKSKNNEIFENVYIAGDFSVRKNKNQFVIVPLKIKNYNLKNIITQGFPFYAGEITFQKEICVKKLHKRNRYFLYLKKLNAVLIKIRINNTDAGFIFKKPYMLDITKLLHQGENIMELTMVNSLRNMLGPLHNKDLIKEEKIVTPWSFKYYKGNWTDKYILKSFGGD